MSTALAETSEKLLALSRRAESLYDDLDLRAVTEWKSRGKNRRAIGFLPIYVPREIIHAAGALPVGLMGGADRVEIVRGDSYFQSYICHLPRSVIELAVGGRMDACDGFLFPSICDVIRNLSGMFKMLLPGKYVHYVDLPQNFDTALGGRFYISELKLMARDIGNLTGVEVTDDRLRASLAAYNENRVALRRLLHARRDRPWEVPTLDYYLLLRAGYMLPVEEHTAMVNEYVELAAQAGRPRMDNIRVAVRGAFCEQPPLGLLRTLERAGCYVVDDDFVLGSRFIEQDLDVHGDPWDALAQGFMHHSLPAASKYDQRRTKHADFVKRVRDYRADGVIFMAPSFCDPALLEQPMLQKALEDADIPFTAFKYSEDTGQFQVIREQAGTFADALKLWGNA
ncbi:MAG: Benzoyl-CoA reductase subunit C [Planctomycetes bacterium]|nr:Benzoyl-CoA reductase subunit C [Planctomycetota bacterium]HRJ77496.1 benzoyl-CoA reductase subunit C [Planctomycetota bacterium]